VSTMGQAFSLPSSALRYLLGHALVYSDHIVICSPWLSDVDVRLPLAPGVDNRRTKLAAAISEFDTTVDVYVLPDESSNEYVLNRLSEIENVKITKVPDLHAKAIVTREYVYVGSANITRGGLLTNLELCKVVINEYNCVRTYLKKEIHL